jgi:hypothetical protein
MLQFTYGWAASLKNLGHGIILEASSGEAKSSRPLRTLKEKDLEEGKRDHGSMPPP